MKNTKRKTVGQFTLTVEMKSPHGIEKGSMSPDMHEGVQHDRLNRQIGI